MLSYKDNQSIAESATGLSYGVAVKGIRRKELRYVYISIGVFFVIVGAIGAFVPLLPTTPFLIVSAACFMRSSPRLYRWLIDNRVLGPFIRNWQENRSIPRVSKIIALAMIVGICWPGILVAADSNQLRIAASIVLLIPVTIISRIRTTESLLTQEN